MAGRPPWRPPPPGAHRRRRRDRECISAPAPISACAACAAPSGVERSSSIIKVIIGAGIFVDRQLSGVAHRYANRAWRAVLRQGQDHAHPDRPGAQRLSHRRPRRARSWLRVRRGRAQPGHLDRRRVAARKRQGRQPCADQLTSGRCSRGAPDDTDTIFITLSCRRRGDPVRYTAAAPLLPLAGSEPGETSAVHRNCGIFTCAWLCRRCRARLLKTGTRERKRRHR